MTGPFFFYFSFTAVIPAETGICFERFHPPEIPAFAGMTQSDRRIP